MAASLCLIPAKGSSTRLPRKNLLPIGDHPMVAHSIRKAIAAGIFDAICISTEDAEIAEVARRYGAEVPFLRPDHLSRDPATVADVALHALEHYAAEDRHFSRICILLPTTPFLLVEDIRAAHRRFAASDASVLMSVTATDFPPYNAWLIHGKDSTERLEPCFPDSPYKHTKSTECPTAYRSNGAIIIAASEDLRAARSFYRSQPAPYVMPQDRSIDIDTRFEYLVAKAIWEEGLVETEGTLFR